MKKSKKDSKSPENTVSKYNIFNAGLIELEDKKFNRHSDKDYVVFRDSKGNPFNELAYSLDGDYYIIYKLNKEDKTFSILEPNSKFKSVEEAEKKAEEKKLKKDEYIIRHENVYNINYGMFKDVESGNSISISLPDFEIKKQFPYIIYELISLGYGWDGIENFKLINLYKSNDSFSVNGDFSSCIKINDKIIFSNNKNTEEEANKQVEDWKAGQLDFVVVNSKDISNDSDLNVLTVDEKYCDEDIKWFIPSEELFDELNKPLELKEGGNYWIQSAIKRKGALRKKATELGYIKEGENLSEADLKKLEELGGIWKKRVQLARNLKNLEQGGTFNHEENYNDSSSVGKLSGLPVYVYENTYFGDSTNNGLTSNVKSLVLVGEGIPNLFEVEEGKPYLQLVKRTSQLLVSGKTTTNIFAVPKNIDKSEGSNSMFGGNFVWSSDSRFRTNVCQYPIPVHDRYENAEGGEMSGSSVIENYTENGVSVDKLTEILGRKPNYPIEKIDNLQLRKCFLKEYYIIEKPKN